MGRISEIFWYRDTPQTKLDYYYSNLAHIKLTEEIKELRKNFLEENE